MKKKYSLIVNFVDDKLSNYQEPSRAGTPKGEKIGLSRKKFSASLMRMTNLKLKEIALKNDVSYPLMRNWCGQDEFKQQVTKHNREFAVHFVNHFLNKLELKEKAFKDFLINSSIEKIMTGIQFKFNDEEFDDFYLYSQELQTELEKECERKIAKMRKAEQVHIRSEYHLLRAIHLDWNPEIGKTFSKRDRKHFDKNYTKIFVGIGSSTAIEDLGKAKELFAKTGLSQLELKEAHYFLSMGMKNIVKVRDYTDSLD